MPATRGLISPHLPTVRVVGKFHGQPSGASVSEFPRKQSTEIFSILVSTRVLESFQVLLSVLL